MSVNFCSCCTKLPLITVNSVGVCRVCDNATVWPNFKGKP